MQHAGQRAELGAERRALTCASGSNSPKRIQTEKGDPANLQMLTFRQITCMMDTRLMIFVNNYKLILIFTTAKNHLNWIS